MTALLAVLLTTAALAETPEPAGSVCLKYYNPKAISIVKDADGNLHVDEYDRIFLYIGAPGFDSGPLRLKPTPRVILEGLDLKKKYRVRVRDSKADVDTFSWKLDFEKLAAPMANIERTGGYWHMNPNRTGKCE